jgi:hypothetical protein
VFRFAVLAGAAVAALAVLAPAPAATSCATRVLRDWSDDGRVASGYSPPCYEQAIDALPTDLRDYTDAQDVITRALTQAVRKPGADGGESREALGTPRVEQMDASPPLALLGAILVAVALLGAGTAAYVVRRVRGDDVAP